MTANLNEANQPVKLADTHCHLDLNNFENDRNKVIERAKLAGIYRILIPGTDLASSWKALQLTMEDPILFAAIGFQPNDVDNWNEQSKHELETLYRNHINGVAKGKEKIKAIGEIGLDYYWNTTSHSLQKKVLLKQLDLAAELNLPVVLHVREQNDASRGECFDDLLEILKKWKKSLEESGNDLAVHPGVIHSFSGDLEIATQAISLGFYIGVTGPVTFKNAKDRQEVISKIALDHLLLETDAPFLAPHPKRGKRNEPGNIPFIAEKIAILHGTSLAKVAETTNANAKKLFNW